MKSLVFSLLLLFITACNTEDAKPVVRTGRLTSITKSNICGGSELTMNNSTSFLSDEDMQYLQSLRLKMVVFYYNTGNFCITKYRLDSIKLYIDEKESSNLGLTDSSRRSN